LVRPGGFTLFCARAEWRAAAQAAAAKAGLRIDVALIGLQGADAAGLRDADGTWARLRQVNEGGAVLVRPDTHVVWRVVDMPAEPALALAAAMGSVLGTLMLALRLAWRRRASRM
jgi:2,4-dichlorophenol 6-monooxygenase